MIKFGSVHMHREVEPQGNIILYTQEGKLTQEAALAYAEKCGIVPPKNISMDRSLSLSKTKEVFNFSVYKWNKVRTVQRLILQVYMHIYKYIHFCLCHSTP